MSWVFENVGIAIVTMVMDDVTRWINEKKCCHYISKLNISKNTVSWVFENVVIVIATMVMDDLMTLVKGEQILSLFNQA